MLLRATIASLLLLSKSARGDKIDDPVDQDLRKMQSTMVYDVVIIGAGWAGLGAARTLRSKGKTNFLILEAEDSVGGRCRTVEIDDVTTAELGCQWIHGATTANPVYNIAKKSGIATIESVGNVAYYSDVFGGIGPHRVPNADIRTISRTHYTNGFFPFQAGLQDSTNQDQSLRQTADKYISNKNLQGDTRLGFEYVLDTNIPQAYAASLEDLSMWWQV
jgi:cation diffusion facilitator CzcD-associated flavoprotein CzcO